MADYTNTTLALAQSAFLANVDWFAEQSSAKANAFISAATALLVLIPNTATKGSNTVGYSKGEIKDMIAQARAFVQAKRTAGSWRRADLRSFRQ